MNTIITKFYYISEKTEHRKITHKRRNIYTHAYQHSQINAQTYTHMHTNIIWAHLDIACRGVELFMFLSRGEKQHINNF